MKLPHMHFDSANSNCLIQICFKANILIAQIVKQNDLANRIFSMRQNCYLADLHLDGAVEAAISNPLNFQFGHFFSINKNLFINKVMLFESFSL